MVVFLFKVCFKNHLHPSICADAIFFNYGQTFLQFANFESCFNLQTCDICEDVPVYYYYPTLRLYFESKQT